MRPLDFASFLVLSCLIWQTRGFAQTPGTPPVTATTPAATALLDATIKALTRPEGVEVRFRQTIVGKSEPSYIQGQVITADKHRVHAELLYQQVKREAKVKLLCDGTTFHRVESVKDQNSIISYTLKDLNEALASLVTTEAERVAKEDMEKEQQGMHGFQGVSAMVADLKKRMIFGDPRDATLELPGRPKHPVKMIEGRWTNDVLDIIAPPKQGSNPNQQDMRYLWNEKMYFFFVPRQARLYFDAGNQQLLRMELVGITEKQGPDKVLMFTDIQSIKSMTTLDPQLFQPTAEELKYNKIVLDLVAELKNRHQQTMNILKTQQQIQK